MAPTPHRIAQTSTELKRQHRKNGALLSERQRKQLARDLELNQRAAQAREAEERRKAAAKKRKEKEAKEAAARKQLGVGLATQLIGYSHTQAQLKNGMEAFLGLTRKKEEERRKKEVELNQRLEETIAILENDSCDGNNDNDDDDGNVNTPAKASTGEQWVDDDVDDDSLLEAHDLVILETSEEHLSKPQPQPAPVSHTMLARPLPSNLSKSDPIRENLEFTRTHGPINKIVEAILDKIPGPLIELLSQDLSLEIPEWDPAAGLLHKLNPVGLPQHRLRIKVGCVVTLLKDLDANNGLLKSKTLKILRSKNGRLECLILDGHLAGTETILTRVPFHAKYRNQHSFERTQFPICVALGSTESLLPSSVRGQIPPAIPPRKSIPQVPQANSPPPVYPGFKLPGLPASKCSFADTLNTTSAARTVQSASSISTDCWDEFFESSTQISREICCETNLNITRTNSNVAAPSPSTTNDFSLMSTQDLDFCLDDLDDELDDTIPDEVDPQPPPIVSKKLPASIPEKAASSPTQRTTQMALMVSPERPLAMTSIDTPTRSSVLANSSRPSASTKKVAGKCRNPGPFATGLEMELSKLRASQLPKSMFGPPAKRKPTTTPSGVHASSVKRPCIVESHPSFPMETATLKVANASFDDFLMSTQDVAAFFDDDDNLSFGSPPIAV